MKLSLGATLKKPKPPQIIFLTGESILVGNAHFLFCLQLLVLDPPLVKKNVSGMKMEDAARSRGVDRSTGGACLQGSAGGARAVQQYAQPSSKFERGAAQDRFANRAAPRDLDHAPHLPAPCPLQTPRASSRTRPSGLRRGRWCLPIGSASPSLALSPNPCPRPNPQP